MTNDYTCTCFPVPEHMHTTHYGATDPASMLEPNPDCPVHFPVEDRDPLVEVHGPGMTSIGSTVWVGTVGSEPPTARDLKMAGNTNTLVKGGAAWLRIDGVRPITKTPQDQALDRVREGAIAWWNGQQR